MCAQVLKSTLYLRSILSVWGVCAACQGNPRARMYASHSWSACSHSILQLGKTPLHYAARNKSAQAAAVVARLLEAGAEVNASNKVSAWEGDG